MHIKGLCASLHFPMLFKYTKIPIPFLSKHGGETDLVFDKLTVDNIYEFLACLYVAFGI